MIFPLVHYLYLVGTPDRIGVEMLPEDRGQTKTVYVKPTIGVG